MDRQEFLENLITEFLYDNYNYTQGIKDLSIQKIEDRNNVSLVILVNKNKIKDIIGNDLFSDLFSENKVITIFSVRWFLKQKNVDLDIMREELKNLYKMLYSDRIHNFDIYLEIVDEG
jgi:hypothetical protein